MGAFRWLRENGGPWASLAQIALVLAIPGFFLYLIGAAVGILLLFVAFLLTVAAAFRTLV